MRRCEMLSKSGRGVVCCQAPLAGLAVWHSVGRGARALYATLHQCQELHVCGVNPGLQISPTILVYADDRPRDASLHSTPLFSYICVCVFVHDWRCPLCHLQHPNLTTPTYFPLFPLVTRVGLTICVPLCSHSEERGSLWSWRPEEVASTDP